MKPTEAVLLTRFVKACCPQQHIDDYTPDAWFDVIGDLDAADCREAVKAIVDRQPFVAPAEIRAEVRRIRNDRITAAPIPAPATDDPAEYIRQLKLHRKAVADGVVPPAAITAGDGAEGWDNPTVRQIREQFDAVQSAARTRQEAERTTERKATRAYIDAQEVLLALDDLGEAAMAQARAELFGEEQAAVGFPLAAAAVGVTDQQKTVIRAAALAHGAEREAS
jgi:hypothetical protein